MGDLRIWNHQADMIDAGTLHAGRGEDICVDGPTGSGKTTVAVLALSILVGPKFSHSLIIAPQEQIEEGFLAANGITARWPGKGGRVVAVPPGFIRAARAGKRGCAKEILEYLRTPNPGYPLACTFSALNYVVKHHRDKIPIVLGGMILLVDEAHHAPADNLSIGIDLWKDRGGLLMFFTATPHRRDGLAVQREDMVLIRRSMSEQMASGLAPRSLEHEVVPYGAKGDKVVGSEFLGQSVSRNQAQLAELARSIVRRWVADGRPKAIVRVPPLAGGSAKLVKLIAKEFAANRARVLDVTGTKREDKQRFLDAIKSERGRRFAESSFDVMIGIQRVLEGTDWAVCSHVYSMGIPGSLQAVIQLLGRATRLKGRDHPFRDTAKITFFVPCGGGEALDQLSIDISRHALMVGVYLADHRVGEEWIVTEAIRKGSGSKGGVEVNPLTKIDPDDYALIKCVMAATKEANPKATIGELVEVVAVSLPDVSKDDLSVVAAHLLASDSKVGGKVRAAIRKRAKRTLVRPEIKEDLRPMFHEILDDFRDETLASGGTLDLLARQACTLSASGIKGMAERLGKAANQGGLLTFEMVQQWCKEWFDRTKTWPNTFSGNVPGTNGENWMAINAAIRWGRRGLPLHQYKSLADCICQSFSVSLRYSGRPFTADLIRNWAIEFRNKHGDYPNTRSGLIPNSGGYNWRQVDRWLQRSDQGVTGTPHKSLLEFIATERKNGPFGDLKSVPPHQVIRAAIENFVSKHNRYPARQSGNIDGSNESWGRLFRIMLKHRHIHGSLAEFIAKEFDVSRTRNELRYTIALLRSWVSAWKRRTGRFPSVISGEIPNSGHENWNRVDSSLRNGRRGISKGLYLSLVDFINREFRNKPTPAKPQSKPKRRKPKDRPSPGPTS